MEYVTIQKGRGVLYVQADQLYRRVRTLGDTKYLKCTVAGYDGSAKIANDHFSLLVSDVLHTITYQLVVDYNWPAHVPSKVPLPICPSNMWFLGLTLCAKRNFACATNYVLNINWFLNCLVGTLVLYFCPVFFSTAVC